MYPEDRVLVGVVNRRRDFEMVQHAHWYRIPYGQAREGIHAEYLAFFMSRAFGAQNGTIRYYARRTGHELVRRSDLLPEEAAHPRAGNLYYKIQLGELREKVPPVENSARRSVAFIHTTWDRFMAAKQIGDLYSQADYFVDRVYYALQQTRISAERRWEADGITDDGGAQLRIPCEDGTLIATTAASSHDERVYLDCDGDLETVQQIVERVKRRIEEMGGPLVLPISLEN